MDPLQSINLLDQVIHHERLRFLSVKEVLVTEQALQVVRKIVMDSLKSIPEEIEVTEKGELV